MTQPAPAPRTAAHADRLRGWTHALDEDQTPLFLEDVDGAVAEAAAQERERIQVAFEHVYRRGHDCAGHQQPRMDRMPTYIARILAIEAEAAAAQPQPSTVIHEQEGTPVERGVSQTTRLSSAPSTLDGALREALERLVSNPFAFAMDPDGDCFLCGDPTGGDSDQAEHDAENPECAAAKARAALAAAQPPEGLDVERLAVALEWDMEQAQAMLRKHGIVFARDLSKVQDKSDEAAWWEKVAFSLYTMLTPHGERVAAIAAAYAADSAAGEL